MGTIPKANRKIIETEAVLRNSSLNVRQLYSYKKRLQNISRSRGEHITRMGLWPGQIYLLSIKRYD